MMVRHAEQLKCKNCVHSNWMCVCECDHGTTSTRCVYLHFLHFILYAHVSFAAIHWRTPHWNGLCELTEEKEEQNYVLRNAEYRQRRQADNDAHRHCTSFHSQFPIWDRRGDSVDSFQRRATTSKHKNRTETQWVRSECTDKQQWKWTKKKSTMKTSEKDTERNKFPNVKLMVV